jgi:hypothetical protein
MKPSVVSIFRKMGYLTFHFNYLFYFIQFKIKCLFNHIETKLKSNNEQSFLYLVAVGNTIYSTWRLLFSLSSIRVTIRLFCVLVNSAWEG